MPNDDFDIIHPVDLLPPQGSDDTMIGLDDTGMIDASSFTANDDFEIIRPIDMIEPQSDDTTIGLDDTGMIYTPPFVAVEDADAAVQTKPVEASDDVDTLYTPPFMPNDDFDIIHPVDLLPPQSDDTMIGLDDSGMIDASSFTAINDVDSDIGSFVEFTGELQDAINSFIDATSANDNASDTPVAANDGQITDNAGDFAGSCTPYYGGCQPDYSVNTTDEPLLAAHKGSAVL